MRVKSTTRKVPRTKSATAIRSQKAPVAATSLRLARTTSAGAIVFGMIVVVVTAVLLTAREEAPRAAIEHQELPAGSVTGEKNATHTPDATKAVAARTVVTSAPERPAASTNQAVEPEPEKVASITIAGCLESSDGTFRLADASGTEAPTSRSWKSGFLKRRPASIELADAVGTLNLRNHVGRRVAATGTLIDREMRAHAVRPVGTCE